MRTYRRVGNYAVQVSARQQFGSAILLFGLALLSLALTEEHGWWFVLGIVLAMWFCITAWFCIRVGFQTLGRQGDAMTRTDRPW